MEKSKELIYIDFGQVDLSPAIIDYDFENKRPRGGSCRIDFFSHGMLSYSLEGIDFDEKIYIRKDNIFFENGVFLLDFKQVQNKPDILLEMVKNMKFNKIYIENSVHYNILDIANKLQDTEIILMQFGCMESGK